jgi:DNA repair protein RecO (recombination protein O)
VNSRYIKTPAVVLFATQFGEGHKLVRLYTETMGRIEATAFGARKTRSRFGSRLEPFTVTTLLLYHKDESNPFTIRESDVIHSNSAIGEDLNKFIIASAIIETIVRYVDRAHRDPELYSLLSEALCILSDLPASKGRYLLSIYDVQFLNIMGYRPDTASCRNCGRELNRREVYSDSVSGFPLCRHCGSVKSVALSEGAVRFVEWALSAGMIDAARVVMEEETLLMVRKAVEHLYLFTFQKMPESWHQLNTLPL